MNAHAKSGEMIAVRHVASVSTDWIRTEVRDRYEAGDPIYPVCGVGMVIADAATLLALADALDSRADRLEEARPRRCARGKCARRDAERMRVAARGGHA